VGVTEGTPTRGFTRPTMSPTAQSYRSRTTRTPAYHALQNRKEIVRILFVHHSPGDIDRCLSEFSRLRFTVNAEVVLTPEQFAKRLSSESFDIVVSEYPSPHWEGTQVLDLLHQAKKEVPLLFLSRSFKRETAAELILRGAADCIEMESLGHISVAIHRALKEKALRDQRDRAEKNLRRSEAQYRALAGNLSYGICRCGLDGNFLEVNDAMMAMLGYGSREELLAQPLARDTIQDPVKRAQLLGHSSKGALVPPTEIEWIQKGDAVLRVRLSGREVLGERGELEAYEIIAEDITTQRELEERLRRQAASDPLTGLVNYRRLIEVIDSEIKRSKRTGREFALLFFDLDGLKLINDRYGHLIGSKALCRLADVLCSSCRDIDTPARFGGDEFAVVLPETSAKEARRVAQRICESVANDINGPHLSVSVGIAVYPQNGSSIETLLSEADSELYSMKRKKVLPIPSRNSGATK
jgi:diguanylate cyclase (GGDEF)-like protein/PAS domain S-box-containing protein